MGTRSVLAGLVEQRLQGRRQNSLVEMTFFDTGFKRIGNAKNAGVLHSAQNDKLLLF
jgi:hypothetical protein